jgi:endonuclease G, mitochondrial
MKAALTARILATGLVISSSASALAEWDSLQARLALVSEDALTPDGKPDQPDLVRGADCDIEDDEVADFDALLPLTADEETASKVAHAKWGLPVPSDTFDGELFLANREYVINYSGSLKMPVYATYVLDASDVVKATREKCFREDGRLDSSVRSVLADYVEPIFDRGHLVPRADMNRSKAVMINTFVLSNMMPQHDQFNQGIWETLESSVRAWTLSNGSLQIVSGAIFDKDGNGSRDADADADRVKPRKQVGIPTHFYKILLHENLNGFIDALAILLPHTDNEVPKTLPIEDKLAYLQDHIVSIDEIEALSGYDFFSEMSDIREKAVERSVAAGLWE